MVWAGIIKDEPVGPFCVEDGLKINSQTYCQFLEDTFFKQWYRKKSAAFKKAMIFIQDNAPSHASKYSTAWFKDDRIMTWPPPSPNLNPIENLWDFLRLRFTVREDDTLLWAAFGRLWLLLQWKLIVNISFVKHLGLRFNNMLDWLKEMYLFNNKIQFTYWVRNVEHS